MKKLLTVMMFGSPLVLGLGCGGSQESHLDIINGTPIEAENSGVTNLSNCSGTLISNRWVLTAEHCISDARLEDGSTVSVRMGSQSVRGSRVLAHPVWDVALVRLDSELAMNGNSSTYERSINRFAPSSLNGKQVSCSGYGRNTFNDGFGTLRTAILKVKSTTDASHILEKNDDGQIPWKGDSGSSCLVNVPGEGQAITGVASTCSYSGETVNTCNFVIATKFREWAIAHQVEENFAAAMATGDFDKDGQLDIAVGHAGDAGYGRVFIYSFSGGTFHLRKVLDQVGLDTNEKGDLFGQALSVGDFNKDGFMDLAVGAPGEKTTSGEKSGKVYIFKGSVGGLSPALALGQAGLGEDEGGDLFGQVLATGDFNKDGFADLAVGAPGEKPGDDPRSGVVFIFNGQSQGLLKAGRVLDQKGLGANESYDLFGHSLAVGDFNHDGYKDLAVGAPGEAPGSDPASGYVFLFKGGADGLIPDRGLGQDELGTHEKGDLFGWALAAGDLNNDGFDNLAVGAPGESPDDHPMSGYVFTFKGSTTGLKPWGGVDQKDLGANEIGDWFGASLAIGDFSGDGRDDLAVGAPGEAPAGDPESGVVFVFKGTANGPSPLKVVDQSGLGVAEKGDWFGGQLLLADFDKDGRAELVVGAPGEAPDANPRWGHAFVYKGAANDLPALTTISR